MNRLTLVVLLVWVALAGVLKADAQPITTIYSFLHGPANPQAGLTLGKDGNFYGTTLAGGQNNEGTLFKMTTNGITTTLVNFNGYGNGASPVANLILGPDGNFYGTTKFGGINADGTVFKVTTNGTLSPLVNFNGTNGGQPQAGLVLGPDGSFYGTTAYGGTNGDGTVFQVLTNGNLTTLVNFNGTNGANPLAGLAVGLGGILYGTTEYGGTNGNYGTVFAVTTNGTFSTLLHFSGTNGAWPYGGVTVGPDGNLYGTTAFGGNPNGDLSGGSIFELTTNGLLTTLVRLADLGGTNGLNPYAGLTLGSDGNFYGTSYGGGANGNGTVFQVTTNGTLAMLAQAGIPFQTIFTPQGYEYYTTNNFATKAEVFNGTLTGLYSFSVQTNSINTDGSQPQASLTLGLDGKLYGTAFSGGTNGYGTVFKVTTNGTFSTLASFNGNNGDNPQDALTPGPNGSLYGTANTGGTSGYGTVFKLTIGGAITTLVNFDRANDGANPQAGLIVGPGGNFYGTAVGGGSNLLNLGGNNYQAVSDGTVFELTTNGAFTPLTYFNGNDGANPYGGLAVGADGNLYGTTTYGGINNDGTFFQLLTNGTLTTLTNFNGGNGANPFASLTLGTDGNFYGTTEAGGASNEGTVFKVTTNGTLTTLVYFNGTNGANPNAGLLLGPDGNFYGTAWDGGTDNYGTVFKVTTGGTLTTLVNFAQTNGEFPVAGLALGPDGNFYGTTELGGIAGNAGTLFKMTTNGTLTTLYGFVYSATSPNGNYPFAGLTLATNGNFIHFYGNTYNGGSGGGGTVFQLDLTTAEAVAENSTNTFYALTNEAFWVTGGTLSLVSAAATNGTAQITGSGIVFKPAANFIGTATINYVVTNNAGGTNASLITVLVTNVPPVANPDVYTVVENSSANVLRPLANDLLGTGGGVLSLVSVSPTNGTAVINGTNVLFTPQANFTGTATIGYTITDNVGGTNASLITVTVANASADLSLSANAAPEPVGVGSNLVYSITVSNAGPSVASEVVVSNQLPAGVSFVSATGGATPTNGVLFANLGSLAEGTNVSVQVVVQPTTAGSLTNSFQVFANEFDPNVTNNAASVISIVTNAPAFSEADVSLIATESPNPVNASNLLTYTFIVSNAGPATATDVTVSNQLFTPGSQFFFNSATGGNTPTNGILLINLGSLAPGATNVAQMTANVRTGVQSISLFTNTFQVYADQADPQPANNFATVTLEATNPPVAFYTTSSAEYDTTNTTTVSQQVTNDTTELIAKLPNGTVVYDQTFTAAFSNVTVQAAIATAALDLTNAGASAYTGPAQTGFSQTTNNSSVTINDGTNINVVVGVKQWVGPVTFAEGNFGVVTGYTFDPVVTNYAIPTGGNPQSVTLTPGETDNDTMILSLFDFLLTTTNTSTYTNASVYVMTGVAAQADVSLSVTAVPESEIVESNMVYFITVSNAGPSAATGVVVSNQLATNVTFVSATGGAVPTNGVLLLNLGTLAAGGTNLVKIVVLPDYIQLDGELIGVQSSVTNTFQVFADQNDPDLTNNSVTVATNIVISGATIFTTSSAEYDSNQTTTVSQQLTNYSTELIAKLPNGTVVYDQTFNLAYSNATVQAAIMTAAVDLTNAGAATYTGPAQTSSLKTTNSVSVTVTNSTSTNYVIGTKEWIGPVTNLVGNFGVISGYTFDPVVTNYAIPTGWNGNPGTDALLPGSIDYDTMVLVLADIFKTTTNTSIYTNSSVYVMTGIVAQADLKLTASAAPEPVGVGSNLVYSLAISNAGPNAASGVVVSNQVPISVSFVSATGGATPSSGILLVNLGSLATGAVTNAQVTVQPTAAGKLTNLFQVFATTADPVLTNNSATVISTITNAPTVSGKVDVALSITAAPNPVCVGSPLTYLLTVTNNSSTTATGVVVTNFLPYGVCLISVLPSQGSASTNGAVVKFNVGTVPNGDSVTLAIVVVPKAAGCLTNVAVASSVQPDSQPANNSVTNVTTVIATPPANLVLTVLTPVSPCNNQPGFFQQQVQVHNADCTIRSWVRVLVGGLPARTTLYDASGTTNGTPFVQSNLPLWPGSNVVFLLTYYAPNHVQPATPTFTVQAGPPVTPPAGGGGNCNISGMRVQPDGCAQVNFDAVTGRMYAIQYSSDLVTWRTATPAFTATTNCVQWTDSGPPQTCSSPAQQGARYYRVILLPAD